MSKTNTHSPNTAQYTVEKYSKERIVVNDSAYLRSKVSLMNTMFELDITDFRQKLKDYKKSAGVKISLHTALLYCYAQTLNNQKTTHALKSSNNKLFIFNDADIYFPFEIIVDGQKLLAKIIIRAANRKSIIELEKEIEKISAIKQIKMPLHERIYISLPKVIRNIGYSILMGMPKQRKDIFGNVYFSTTQGLGNDMVTAFSIPIHFHSIGMFCSPCKLKKVTEDGNIKIRSTIGITVSADHAIINGLDLARFVKEFIEKINNISF